MSFTDAEIFEAFAESASYAPARSRSSVLVSDFGITALARDLENLRWRAWARRNPKANRARKTRYRNKNRKKINAYRRAWDARRRQESGKVKS